MNSNSKHQDWKEKCVFKNGKAALTCHKLIKGIRYWCSAFPWSVNTLEGNVRIMPGRIYFPNLLLKIGSIYISNWITRASLWLDLNHYLIVRNPSTTFSLRHLNDVFMEIILHNIWVTGKNIKLVINIFLFYLFCNILESLLHILHVTCLFLFS